MGEQERYNHWKFQRETGYIQFIVQAIGDRVTRWKIRKCIAKEEDKENK